MIFNNKNLCFLFFNFFPFFTSFFLKKPNIKIDEISVIFRDYWDLEIEEKIQRKNVF